MQDIGTNTTHNVTLMDNLQNLPAKRTKIDTVKKRSQDHGDRERLKAEQEHPLHISTRPRVVEGVSVTVRHFALPTPAVPPTTCTLEALTLSYISRDSPYVSPVHVGGSG
ncbi:hypothetical protein SLA2020_006510 [Shorea laevis]